MGWGVLRPNTRPTWGAPADVGVRPTICADVRKWQNYAALSSDVPAAVEYPGDTS
jgi:hypothetical protein